MKKIIVLIFFFQLSGQLAAQISPQSFGLKLSHGQIDTRLDKNQKDTILINFFTPEDIFLDIAIYYKSKNEIVIFKNLGNGYLDTLKKFTLNKEAGNIESYLSGSVPIFLQPRFDIKIYYQDATQTILRNKEINSQSKEDFSISPYRDITYDSKIFLYEFQFIEKWISERTGMPYYWVPRGDVDNDGRNEFVHTFYPISPDSINLYWPAHLVIFESYGNNQIRVDWDTILKEHYCGNFFDEFFDFDRNGKKEFLARAYFPTYGYVETGAFECSGEGKYRFYATSDFNNVGTFLTFVSRDSMESSVSKNAGIWINYYKFPPDPANSVRGFVFRERTANTYKFDRFPTIVAGTSLQYEMDVGDIDGDPQEEIVVGDNQWQTNYIHYLDSTGIASNGGYVLKTIIPNARVAGGFLNLMNYDENETKEITVCGIALGRGSIGVVKHVGSPGQNMFQTMWWDSVGIVAQPNWNIDSGTINKEFTILYPSVDIEGSFHCAHTMTYALNSQYSYYRSSFTKIDSQFFYNPRFIDLDKDNFINIVASGGFGHPTRFYVYDYEYDGLTQIIETNNSTIAGFELFQNYPNPFNPITIISYQLSDRSKVMLKVFDILGKEVIILVDKIQDNGKQKVEFNGINLPSGVYFYALFINGKKADIKKMLLTK